MKLILKRLNFIFIILAALVIANYNLAQNYSLVWSDEFSGSAIDANNWTHEIGGGGWGNNELQFYTERSDNSYIENGQLVIEAKEESYGGRDYTSARMITKGKRFFRYGKVEARIKLPYGQGIWPAFWMLGENISSVGWPACGEIDIMELIGGPNKDNTVHGTLHWDSNGHSSNGTSYTLSNGIFADDYHIFAIEWNPSSIKWYVDGNRYLTIDITAAEYSEFRENFFIILNIAVGGNWPGSPNSSTVFPQKMYIDYVRVFEDLNATPSISLIEPNNNTNFSIGDEINITADVQFGGELQAVDFYQDAVRIGTTNLEPYSMTWRNVNPGCYSVAAKAITSEGYEGESQTINIKVGDECVEAPYTGHPFLIPGSIEVENFNLGDPDYAYHDNDISNNGGKYRLSDHVDIENCSDENGGYNIGWIEAGEWIEYFIYVETAGNYQIDGRVASPNNQGAFRVEVEGQNISGTMNVPNTGDWQNWSSISSSPVFLDKGNFVLRIFIESGSFNLNRLDIYPVGAVPEINLIFPNEGETLGIGTIQEIKWRSIMVNDMIIGLSTNNGQSWEFITQSTPAEFGVYRWLVPEVNSNDCYIMIIDKDDSSVRDTTDLPFTIDIVNSTEETTELVKKFNLEQNYPNPFNPETKIVFSLAKAGNTKLSVFNLLGEHITTLFSSYLNEGIHEVEFNPYNLPSGVYIYKLQMDDNFQVKKMLYQK